MDPVSGAMRAERHAHAEDDGAAVDRRPRELDPSTVRNHHGAADLAAIARNLAHGVESVGRSHMSSSASASRTYATEPEARAAFAAQSKKLLDVSQWNALSGRENATFALCDSTGASVWGRPASVGDFVRIRLPGQSQSDWVRIEQVVDTPDRASILVRPSYDPSKRPLTPSVIAHFFTHDTTNLFSLTRTGTNVAARVQGSNESANVGPGSGGAGNALRNRVVSESAWGLQRRLPGTHVSVNGMQQHQWNRFTESLVETRP